MKVKLINNLETDSENGAGKIVISNYDQLFLSFNTPKKSSLAQDTKDLRGKIISINLKTNDFEIHTSGHRNPQGLFIDDDNNFFATEHGPYGGDELNLISKNKNYGWPIASDGLSSSETYEKTYGDLGRHSSEFEKPIYSWTPGIGISDLIKVKSFDKTWNNDLLVSSLKNKTLYRVRLDFSNKTLAVRYIEDIWIGHRIRHIKESFDKKIMLFTDDGFLIEISKANKGDDKWVDTRSNVCLSCHHLGVTNQTHAAPTLVGIFNRYAGSDPNYQYSNAFKDKNFQWNEHNITKYLLDPQKFLPGTTKPYKAANLIEASKAIVDLKRIAITSK
jgi:cytochrome c2